MIQNRYFKNEFLEDFSQSDSDDSFNDILDLDYEEDQSGQLIVKKHKGKLKRLYIAG
ncbi:hypothetical protein J4214_04205 [Candidatus Woesearchaeota archaeon]|nr:hypothetical protein [Candidatus Woesearchaeota archaeon]